MAETSDSASTGGLERAAPNDSEMHFYARAYNAGKTPDELFARWQTFQSHAVLLAQAPDRFHDDYGLNCRQLAAGALIAALQAGKPVPKASE